MSTRILVAEDEANIRKVVASCLVQEGFEVVEAADGLEAFNLFEEQCDTLSLVMLDVMMPRLDGYSACRQIRSLSPVPILMLTARDTEQDEMTGFSCGADEYIAKPFSSAILVARVKNLLRRSGQDSMENLELGDIRAMVRERSVTAGGKRITLTPKEFDLLCYLMRNCGLVLSRQQILDRIWGLDYDGDDRTVDTHIKCLRAKLGNCGSAIITLRRVGYKFEANN